MAKLGQIRRRFARLRQLETARQRSDDAKTQSEARYQALVESLPHIFYEMDLQGNFTFANSYGLQVARYTQSDVTRGVNALELLVPEERERAAENIRRIVLGEQMSGTEYTILRKDGTTFPVLAYATPIVHDSKIIGIRGSCVDLTPTKQMQAELNASRAAFMSIVEESRDGIIVVDRNGSVVYSNPTAHSLFPSSGDSLVGKTFGLPVVPNEVAEIHVIREGELAAVEMRASNTEWNGHPAHLVVLRDITRQQRAEEALRGSEERMRLIIESSPIGISIIQDGKRVFVNPAFVKTFGYDSVEEILRIPVDNFYAPEDRELLRRQIEYKLKAGQNLAPLEAKGLRKDGTSFEITVWLTRIDYGGEPAILTFVMDVSAERALRAQLLQAQKMEAIGTLAGGIAHDFNNLLTVILGFSELLLADKTEKDRNYADLQKIAVAGQRGADLVRRILTFSRKIQSEPRPVDLNQEVKQIQGLISRTIPKMIHIELKLDDSLKVINADPAQIEQVLLNLAVNAQDAMPEGGSFVIETTNVILDVEYCNTHLEAEPGEYVALTISDTGQGIKKEHLDRIFEPFYTTKKPGEGTGLGLAMVYGIVKSHGGYIDCYSEPGRGTAFKIYLPVTEEKTEADVSTTQEMTVFGTETILLVDDEEFVISLGRRILTGAGFTVVTAASGEEALEIFREKKHEISLVILDLIMPRMGGKQCLEELLKIDPSVKVIIASGYFSHGPAKDSDHAGAKGFVGKPYKVKQVLQVVRQVLDAD